MYIGSFFKHIFNPRKFFSLVYFLLNTFFVFLLFGGHGVFGGFYESFLIPRTFGVVAALIDGGVGVLINFVVLMLALSPIGEWFFGIINGFIKIEHNEQNKELLAIFDEVYARARQKDPSLSGKIKLYLVNSDEISAYALGRNSIAITSAMVTSSLSDDHIKAILAHEFGHISNHDSDMKLAVTVGNFMIFAILVVFKVTSFFSAMVLAIVSRNFSYAVRHFIMLLALVLFRIWTKIGALIVLKTSRADEFVADRFARNCGYGDQLAEALTMIDNSVNAGRRSVLQIINSTHPATVDRVDRLTTK